MRAASVMSDRSAERAVQHEATLSHVSDERGVMNNAPLLALQLVDLLARQGGLIAIRQRDPGLRLYWLTGADVLWATPSVPTARRASSR